jgi:hypothetical protein
MLLGARVNAEMEHQIFARNDGRLVSRWAVTTRFSAPIARRPITSTNASGSSEAEPPDSVYLDPAMEAKSEPFFI